jgi:hypothetical protein
MSIASLLPQRLCDIRGFRCRIHSYTAVGRVGVGEIFLIHNFLTPGWDQLRCLGLAAGRPRNGYQPLGFEVVQAGAEVALVVVPAPVLSLDERLL